MTNRIVRKAEVLHRCGLSNASLYRQIAKGEFPRQRHLSSGGRAVGWLESEIDEWVNSRVSTNPSHL